MDLTTTHIAFIRHCGVCFFTWKNTFQSIDFLQNTSHLSHRESIENETLLDLMHRNYTQLQSVNISPTIFAWRKILISFHMKRIDFSSELRFKSESKCICSVFVCVCAVVAVSLHQHICHLCEMKIVFQAKNDFVR